MMKEHERAIVQSVVEELLTEYRMWRADGLLAKELQAELHKRLRPQGVYLLFCVETVGDEGGKLARLHVKAVSRAN